MSFLQIQKNRSKDGTDFTYVYLTSSKWQPKKKYPRQQRTYLGRLDESGEQVIISKSFTGNRKKSVKISELRKRLEAGENMETWLHMKPANKRSGKVEIPARVEIVGDIRLLMKLASDLGIDAILDTAFGNKDGKALLALSIFQAVEGRALYLAEDWLNERELLETMKNSVDSETVYALVTRCGANIDERERFFEEWLKRFKASSGIICDTTSISTYSPNLESAEYGYNRDGENLPQINLNLAADQDSGLPIWYRTLPGSIPDASSLMCSSSMLMELGLRSFSFSLDRGFYSQSNINELLANGLNFLIGVPFSVKQASSLVRKYRIALMSPKRSFLFHGKLMRYVKSPWKQTTCKKTGKSRELEAHLFYEPTRQSEQVKRLEAAVFSLEEKAAKEIFLSKQEAYLWRNENAGGLSCCLAVKRDSEDKILICRKARAVAKMTSNMGYALVLSSKAGLNPEEALTRYRNRDQVEKLFDSLKNEDGHNRLRTGVDESASGRLLIAFVSLILRAELENRMRKAKILRQMSIPLLFAQTRKIKTIYMRPGKRLLFEIPRKLRVLFEPIVVPIPS